MSPEENKEKLDKSLDEWLSTRDESFKKKHLIPDDSHLWKIERFDGFIQDRRELIEKRLKAIFG